MQCDMLVSQQYLITIIIVTDSDQHIRNPKCHMGIWDDIYLVAPPVLLSARVTGELYEWLRDMGLPLALIMSSPDT